MALLNFYIDIVSDSETVIISNLTNIFPTSNLVDSYFDHTTEYLNQSNLSGLRYCYCYDNLDYIENSINDFLGVWKIYSDTIKTISAQGVEFHITFEFTITDWNFPAIAFEKDFIDFISEHNISFGMYFWSGDAEHNQNVD